MCHASKSVVDMGYADANSVKFAKIRYQNLNVADMFAHGSRISSYVAVNLAHAAE